MEIQLSEFMFSEDGSIAIRRSEIAAMVVELGGPDCWMVVAWMRESSAVPRHQNIMFRSQNRDGCVKWMTEAILGPRPVVLNKFMSEREIMERLGRNQP